MVIYDLVCEFNHDFEGWFDNSDDLLCQQQEGLLTCPFCDSKNISKKISAIKIGGKVTRAKKKDRAEELAATPTLSTKPTMSKKELLVGKEAAEKFSKYQKALSEIHDHINENFENVGNRFTEEAISMHNGEKEKENIRGTVSREQMDELKEQGVEALPLPPKPINKKKLN